MTGPAKTTAKKTAKDTPEPDPCELCWPDGWPTPDTERAHCEHGQWARDPS